MKKPQDPRLTSREHMVSRIANRVGSVGKVPFVCREVDTFRRGQTFLLSDSVILSILALVYFQQGKTKIM